MKKSKLALAVLASTVFATSGALVACGDTTKDKKPSDSENGKEPVVWTVTFAPDEGTLAEGQAEVTATITDGVLSITSFPDKSKFVAPAGQELKGWSTDPLATTWMTNVSEIVTAATSVNGNIILYAVYANKASGGDQQGDQQGDPQEEEETKYTITLHVSEDEEYELETDENGYLEELPEKPEPPEGYKFDGWFTDEEGGDKFEFSLGYQFEDDIELWAQYSPVEEEEEPNEEEPLEETGSDVMLGETVAAHLTSNAEYLASEEWKQSKDWDDRDAEWYIMGANLTANQEYTLNIGGAISFYIQNDSVGVSNSGEEGLQTFIKPAATGKYDIYAKHYPDSKEFDSTRDGACWVVYAEQKTGTAPNPGDDQSNVLYAVAGKVKGAALWGDAALVTGRTLTEMVKGAGDDWGDVVKQYYILIEFNVNDEIKIYTNKTGAAENGYGVVGQWEAQWDPTANNGQGASLGYDSTYNQGQYAYAQYQSDGNMKFTQAGTYKIYVKFYEDKTSYNNGCSAYIEKLPATPGTAPNPGDDQSNVLYAVAGKVKGAALWGDEALVAGRTLTEMVKGDTDDWGSVVKQYSITIELNQNDEIKIYTNKTGAAENGYGVVGQWEAQWDPTANNGQGASLGYDSTYNQGQYAYAQYQSDGNMKFTQAGTYKIYVKFYEDKTSYNNGCSAYIEKLPATPGNETEDPGETPVDPGENPGNETEDPGTPGDTITGGIYLGQTSKGSLTSNADYLNSNEWKNKQGVANSGWDDRDQEWYIMGVDLEGGKGYSLKVGGDVLSFYVQNDSTGLAAATGLVNVFTTDATGGKYNIYAKHYPYPSTHDQSRTAACWVVYAEKQSGSGNQGGSGETKTTIQASELANDQIAIQFKDGYVILKASGYWSNIDSLTKIYLWNKSNQQIISNHDFTWKSVIDCSSHNMSEAYGINLQESNSKSWTNDVTNLSFSNGVEYWIGTNYCGAVS